MLFCQWNMSNIDQLWMFLAYSVIGILADHYGYPPTEQSKAPGPID
jgi:hypothetical protein